MLLLALLLLLLLAAGLTVSLARLAGVAGTTTTTTLLLNTTEHCLSHLSVSGCEYYTAARVLQVGQVWLLVSQMAMALASNT